MHTTLQEISFVPFRNVFISQDNKNVLCIMLMGTSFVSVTLNDTVWYNVKRSCLLLY